SRFYWHRVQLVKPHLVTRNLLFIWIVNTSNRGHSLARSCSSQHTSTKCLHSAGEETSPSLGSTHHLVRRIDSTSRGHSLARSLLNSLVGRPIQIISTSYRH